MYESFEPHARTGGRRSGFSLMELLLVLSVIGILGALALPAIDRLRTSAESAMVQVGTTLQAAQREAVARQHDVVVEFHASANSMQLIFDQNGNGLADGGERVRGVGLDPVIRFGRPGGAPPLAFGGATFNFNSGAPRVTFHRNGSTSSAGGLYLSSTRALAGESKRVGDTRAIELIRATGRIEWYRYNGAAWMRGF